MKCRTGEVQLDYMNKAFSYHAQSFDFKPGDIVIVETDYGLDMGLLVNDIVEREVPEDKLPLKKMLRLATEHDLTKQEAMIPREENAYEICNAEIEKSGLSMKLVSARFSFDGSRVSFCYTAENRVDFRELVKSLASRLRTRIELRQVGVRDEARLFGGYGPCGRQLCCASFLRDFKSVSIKMAKEQGLPLNPLKISGICGRLFCCLKYEYEYYIAVKGLMPVVGKQIERGEVKGRITSVNVLKQTVTVKTEGGGWSELDIEIPEDKLLERIKEVECSCRKNEDNCNNNCRRKQDKSRKQDKKKQAGRNRHDEKEPASEESTSPPVREASETAPEEKTRPEVESAAEEATATTPEVVDTVKAEETTPEAAATPSEDSKPGEEKCRSGENPEVVAANQSAENEEE